METPTFCSQRGLPFNPRAAAEKRDADAKRSAVRREREAQRERTLAHARRLDQIEHAWKERARDRRE